MSPTLSPQFRFETPPPAYTADGQEGLKPLATPGLAPPYSEQAGSAIDDLIFGLIRYVEQKKTFPVKILKNLSLITLEKEVDVTVTRKNEPAVGPSNTFGVPFLT